jgi:hypothetical protein
MINLKPIYQRIQKRYNKRGLDISFKEIKILVDNFYYQAKQNYSKLSVPKFCSQNAYISLWLNQEIGKDIAPKSVKPINLKNPPKDFKAIAEFYKNYPPLSLEQKINQKQTNDINDKKQKWLAVIKERNQFSIDKGYESRLDMYFDDFNIPKSEYEKFLKTVDKVIIFCKNQIYSNWKPQTNQNLDNYCLVCNSNFFPFKNLDEFLVFFKKKNKFYKENKDKIIIESTNESRTEYIKENDTFKITINKNTHINHQIIELAHELSHAETMAKILSQDKFIQPKAYFLEKLAIKKEINFFTKYFPQALIALQGSILRMIYQTLFEIEIYQNPDKNPNEIYLKYLKKCSKNISKSDNWNYLSNQDILYKCFTQLIYAIAYTNTLNTLIN